MPQYVSWLYFSCWWWILSEKIQFWSFKACPFVAKAGPELEHWEHCLDRTFTSLEEAPRTIWTGSVSCTTNSTHHFSHFLNVEEGNEGVFMISLTSTFSFRLTGNSPGVALRNLSPDWMLSQLRTCTFVSSWLHILQILNGLGAGS